LQQKQTKEVTYVDFFEPKEVIISNRKVRVEASYRMYGFKDIMIKVEASMQSGMKNEVYGLRTVVML
jgi:hypothetical protein